MTATKRIVVNTIAQYIRTILNVGLSLYSTRLILSALGQTDFGIYSVVAGVVAMLAFMTNALSTTTQRFLSYNHGKSDMQVIYGIFGNSMLLHEIISIILLIVLLSACYPIIYHFLNIDTDRQNAALIVYICATLMLTFSIICAPIRSIFIARENIVYVSIIDVADGVLKLAIAFLLLYIPYDHLISYGVFLVGIQLFNLLALGIYARIKFSEYHWPTISEWNNNYIKSLTSFAGWTLYSSGCVIARNQGIAILINIFLGAVVNAAYGIAQQVAGAVAYVSSSIINAMNPQIMKAEGTADREHMIALSEYESKYAFLLLSMVAIPLIFEMDNILHVWLTTVSKYTTEFCQLVLLASLADQLTIGLTSANQAIGRIRNYTLWFYTTKLLTLLLIGIGLYFKMNVGLVLWFYVGVELLGSVIRLPLLKHEAQISILHFCKQVFARELFPILVICCTCYLCVRFIDAHPFRFLLTFGITVATGMVAIGCTALDAHEREKIRHYINKNAKY